MQPTSIRTALALLDAALPTAGVVVWVRGAQGEIVTAAGDVDGLFGRPASALVGEAGGAPEPWVHPDDGFAVAEGLGASDDGASIDYRVCRPDGSERWVRETLSPVGGGGERLGVVRDIGVERSLRAQVGALEERIWRSQRVDSLGALAAGIAHDFNNLLTTIVSAVQLAREEDLPAAVEEDLSVVFDAAERGSAMVRQILRFAARDGYDPGPVDLSRTVSELELILRRTLGAGVVLEVDCDPDLPTVYGDAAQLEQVVLNLAVNARDAMPDGGTLLIETWRETLSQPLRVGDRTLAAGTYAVLGVRDTGHGIPAHARRRIFEPFFTTKNREGSGFGLSTVLRIVRGLGGGVHVESEEGQGTTFSIWLPVREAPALPGPPAAGAGSAQGLHILVVEDDPTVREIVLRVLVRRGHAVTAAGSAAEALSAFDRARPRIDLAILDVILPDRSGPELARALRRRVEGLPVVLVSGYGEEALDRGGPRVPGARFLEKPFAAEDLVEVLDAVVGGSGADRRRDDTGT